VSGSQFKQDVIVVGAGLSGMYQLHKLRERGFKARVLEAGTGVAGTWYWNRYPGARCDSTAECYQYWFSEELLNEWNWSERFPAQPETERYLNYVADKFDLRRDIQFNTRVSAANFDPDSGRWTIITETGEQFSAQFLVMATGGLSTPAVPTIAGYETFKGQSFHTGRWPRHSVDFAGQRVGVIGTGATGIQVIQTIAPEVEHLTVFQRTASYAIPMRNPQYDHARMVELRQRYPAMKELVHNTFTGNDYDFGTVMFADLTPAEREARLWEYWRDGSLKFWVGAFGELFADQVVNDYVSDFVRARIRERVRDPQVAAKLLPTNYGFGTRRVPLESGYFEVFNRPNVSLVDTTATPIKHFTENSIQTSDGEYPLDMLIFATGFDAGTGSLTAIDICGRDGLSLRDAWARDGVRAWMGLQVHGFPNMFMIMAPLSPAAAFCNVPTCSQQQADWISNCIAYTCAQGSKSIEPTAQAEAAWGEHHDELANATLVPNTKSWYMGTNIDGKPRRLLAYVGGASTYRYACDKVAAEGYQESVFA
jgi:acetone monooxygenase (methyl acetate-forming)